MCCGEVKRRLDDQGCQWLYNRHAGGESKRLLCTQFRIGADEFDRAVKRGAELGRWPVMSAAQAASPTFNSLV